MSKFVKCVAGGVCAAIVVGGGAGITHHEGLWSSKIVDKTNEDSLLRTGKLACGIEKPLPIKVTASAITNFLGSCAYDRWCDRDPDHVFEDQSVTPNVEYIVCADPTTAKVTRYITFNTEIGMQLTAYRIDGTRAGTDKTSSQVQVLIAPEQVDPLKLGKVLEDSSACSTWTEPITATFKADMDGALPFKIDVVLRGPDGYAINCGSASNTPNTAPTA